MEQTFIRVKKGENFYNKDIKDSNSKERSNWYDTLSKGQIAHVLEQFVVNYIKEEARIWK